MLAEELAAATSSTERLPARRLDVRELRHDNPVFYGTNKVLRRADKDMDQTPLCGGWQSLRLLGGSASKTARQEIPPCALWTRQLSPTDQLVLARLLAICDTARLLVNLDSGRARECGEHILREVHHLFSDLQEMGVVSYGAASPVEQDYRDE